MQAVRRFAHGDPGMVTDAGIAIAAVGLVAAASWGPASLVGAPLAGPPWLRALLPLLIGAPLALRRRAPLLMWIAIWAGIALQYRINGYPLQNRYPLPNLELMVVLATASYSLGAHATLRRAAAGLAIGAVMIPAWWGVLPGFSHPGGAVIGVSFILLLAVCWLAGVLVRARRQSASLAERNDSLRRQAEQAAAAERTRIARELHDIVAHHLSVIVLQAAGARASGKPAGVALEKIENSGRQALAETRRLLGVLRDPGEDTGLAPQPGIGELDALAGTVRAAGLPVNLAISGDPAAIPDAVDVSVYRIVQESLTNVLKHAGPAHADVTVGCAEDAITIEITDNGTGATGNQPPAGGHGLAGMRERAAMFGGEFRAGPRPGGGFTVRARLPVGDRLSAGALS